MLSFSKNCVSLFLIWSETACGIDSHANGISTFNTATGTRSARKLEFEDSSAVALDTYSSVAITDQGVVSGVASDYCMDFQGNICNGCLLVSDSKDTCSSTTSRDNCINTYWEQERYGVKVRGAWCGGCNFYGLNRDVSGSANTDNSATSANSMDSSIKHYIQRFTFSGDREAFCPFCLQFYTDGSSRCAPDIHSAAECRKLGTGSWCPSHPGFPVAHLCKLGWHGQWCNGCLVDMGGAWPRCDINLSKNECAQLTAPHKSTWCPMEAKGYPAVSCIGDDGKFACQGGCLVRWSDGVTHCMREGPIWKKSECEAAAGSWTEEVIDLSLEIQFKRVAAKTKWCGPPTVGVCMDKFWDGINEAKKTCNACYEYSNGGTDGASIPRFGCNTFVNEKGCDDYKNYKCMFPADERRGSCGTVWCPTHNFTKYCLPTDNECQGIATSGSSNSSNSTLLISAVHTGVPTCKDYANAKLVELTSVSPTDNGKCNNNRLGSTSLTGENPLTLGSTMELTCDDAKTNFDLQCQVAVKEVLVAYNTDRIDTTVCTGDNTEMTANGQCDIIKSARSCEDLLGEMFAELGLADGESSCNKGDGGAGVDYPAASGEYQCQSGKAAQFTERCFVDLTNLLSVYNSKKNDVTYCTSPVAIAEKSGSSCANPCPDHPDVVTAIENMKKECPTGGADPTPICPNKSDNDAKTYTIACSDAMTDLKNKLEQRDLSKCIDYQDPADFDCPAGTKQN